MLETITLEKSIQAALPIATSLYEKNIKPILESELIKFFKKKIEIGKFKSNQISYIASIAGQSSIINTIAFQNAPKKLDDLYIPLTISKVANNEKIKITNTTDIFKKDKKVLIADNAGMGKSTIAKRVIHNVIKKGDSIPVFVELRKLQNSDIENYISTLLKIEKDCLVDVLKKMPLVFIFDGIDELETSITKDSIESIKGFINKLEHHKFLVTSRHEIYLSEFHDFLRYNIEPMTKNESFTLINKYDPTGMIATKLISGIKNANDNNINDFLSTPLYVSLLFCSYRHKTVIPQKKFMFYSQVYEALFESHDLSKDVGYVRKKHSSLDSVEFHTILRRLGFFCLKNGGKIEFMKDELEIIISGIIKECPDISCSSSNFVKDITTTVPLFVKEGSNIRWSHKSLMEYFAAMFICHDAKEKSHEVLLKMYHSTSWHKYINVFELCADINYTIFKSSIAETVLSEYISKYEEYSKKQGEHFKPKLSSERFCLSYGSKIRVVSLANFNGDSALRSIIEEDDSSSDHKIFHSIISMNSNPIVVTTYRGKESYILKIIATKAGCDEIKRNRDISISDFAEKIHTQCKENNHMNYSIEDSTSFLNKEENFEAANEILKYQHIALLPIDLAKDILESIRRDRTDGIDSLLQGF
ncbi:NACHT domain-containing protein [Rheinheimera soli]|uniref:NACHT domain-containing protein n=1 Tax=Rheinheimera soli TaxID=443616 RepID=A0ABU1W1N0_9GAMM|nr:NACHT domain-containing protein [Rheinheimera soli]MDR7121846.1 hypothetical protein [Rheinheimera soli]